MHHFGRGLELASRMLRLSRLCLKNVPTSSAADSQILALGQRKSPLQFEQEKQGNRKKGRSKQIHWSAGAIGMLAIPAAAFSLGVWQTYRLQWKLELIEEMKQKLDSEAVPFPVADLEKLIDMEYRRVRITGEFLNEREFVITPRGRFDPGFKQKDAGSLLSDNDMSSHGGHVVTPFKIDGSNLVILVNRGWVPSFYIDRLSRLDSDVKGTTTIEAIVRRTEPRPQFMQQNQPEKGVWFYRNHEEMAKRYGTAPVFVDLAALHAAAKPVPGAPIPGQTNVRLRNEHMQYLCTWFTLSIVTTIMWLSKFYK